MKSGFRPLAVGLIVLTIIALLVIAASTREQAIAPVPHPTLRQPAQAAMAVQRAAAAAQPATKPAVTVRIENFAFLPRDVQVPVGGTVTWQNADDVPHTATSKGDAQVFDSGALDTDDTYSFTFSKPGAYPYYCKVHPHMTGVITVK
jgi:plastocyanin